MAQFTLPDQPLRRRARTGLTSVWANPQALPEATQTADRPFVDGVAWQGDQTLDPQPLEGGCSTPAAITVDTTVPILRSLPPFYLVQTDRCSNGGPQMQDLSRQRAIRNLEAAESWALERVLATGQNAAAAPLWDEAQPGIRFFQDNDAATVLVTPAAPAAIGRSIGILEGEYQDREHCLGTVHVTLEAFAVMVSAGLAVRGDSGRWVTPAGSLVSAGAGYTGRSKAGVAKTDGRSWMFYTGDVHAWFGPLETMESHGYVGDGSMDNARITIVQRPYVLAPAGETWLAIDSLMATD